MLLWAQTLLVEEPGYPDTVDYLDVTGSFFSDQETP
jgi:hypothetical protein